MGLTVCLRCRDIRVNSTAGTVASSGMTELTQERLTQLLRDAERAHGEYERTLGRRDDDWPEWYATYIVEQLAT